MCAYCTAAVTYNGKIRRTPIGLKTKQHHQNDFELRQKETTEQRNDSEIEPSTSDQQDESRTPKLGFIYRLGNTKFEIEPPAPEKWKVNTTSEFDENNIAIGFEQNLEVSEENKRERPTISWAENEGYDLEELESQEDSDSNFETDESSETSEEDDEIFSLKRSFENDVDFSLGESSPSTSADISNSTLQGNFKSKNAGIDILSSSRFVYRLGRTKFESQNPNMDSVVTSYVGTRKLVDSVNRSRHVTSSNMSVEPGNSSDGVTNPAYDSNLDDDTGETKHAITNDDESDSYSSPTGSKINLDEVSSEGSTPTTIAPHKRATMTFTLKQPLIAPTQQYSSVSVSRTVTTISSTSSTVTVSSATTNFTPAPSSVTSSSAESVYASPTLAEIASSSNATNTYTSMTQPSSNESTVSTNQSYKSSTFPRPYSSPSVSTNQLYNSSTFPRPSSSPPAPPEPSHPAPPSPPGGTPFTSPAPSSMTSPSEPSHPAPSSPPTSAYSSSSLPLQYGTTHPSDEAPGPLPQTTSTQQQQRLNRLRRTNTAPPWLPSLPSQPSEPTPPPTPPSSPPSTPPKSPPPSTPPKSPPPSPPNEPSHPAPSSPPSTIQSSNRSTLLNLAASNASTELPPDLHIPLPPDSPPPPLTPDDDDDIKEISKNIPDDDSKDKTEDVIQKQEVSVVESSLVLSDNETDSTLRLVESEQKPDASEKVPMEDIIQEMIKELPQEEADGEESPETLLTDTREEVYEPVVDKKAVVPRKSEPKEITQQPSNSHPNETISLPANNPNVFRKNRAREEETRAGHANTNVPPRNARHLEGRHSDSDESEPNTWYISPPANKGRQLNTNGDRQTPGQTVIDIQPTDNVWVPYPLDPVSKAELEDLNSVHKTHEALKDILKTELGEMSKEAKEGQNKIVLNDSISYTEFFRGLLYDDEEILMNNQFIPFRHAVFNLLDNWLPTPNSSTNQSSANSQVMTMGRAILTNHRLVLISAEQQKGAELRKLDLTSDNGKPDAYQIRTNHHDTLHYRCIPLNKFHSIEMQAAVGVVKTTNVTGHRMSCWSCRCLPGCDLFSKRWQAQETVSSRTNTRLVTCGVVLPPWDSRAALQIYMDPSVPLYHVKNFMLELQKNAPGLHPSSASFAGY